MSVETAKEYRQLATKYRAFGFNLVPLGSDKRPAVTGVAPHGGLMRFRWDDWQQTKQIDAMWAQIKKHEWWVDVGGLGGVCGPVSDDMVCIDFDTPKDRTDLVFPFELVERFLQGVGLTDSLWIVNSPRGGFHVWARCTGLEIEKGKFDRPALGLDGGYHIELRWTGHYAALPGSHHPNGIYQWHGEEPTEAPPFVDRDALLTAYADVTKEPEVKPLPSTLQLNGNGFNGNGHNGTGDGGSKWARAALDAELAKLAGVREGRNNALNNAALALGQIVAGGYLDESEVVQALTMVAESIGLDAGEITPTIRSGLAAGMKSPRHPAERGEVAYYDGFDADMPDVLDLDALDALDNLPSVQELQKHVSWPYAVRKGRMVYLFENKDGDTDAKPIADFTASIVEEIVDEHGNSHLVIEGKGLRRGTFRCEISGQDFGSDVRLLATLTAATGGIDIVYNAMSPHLRPAIGKLTAVEDRPQRTRYYRTGWQDDSYLSFLMPGMDDTTLISVPRQIAYCAPNPQADLELGLLALTNLVDAMKPELTAPVVASLFMPPMLRPAGLGNERVAVFIAGRTGSLKTSWAQTAMCLYGPGFASNDNLLKLGEGATRNAIMAFAAHAHDMPLLIDNYKPNTGNGKHDFVNLIHNILEGGDRKRSSRDGELRDTKLVRCIPIVTGEDLPRDDAASIARILLVTFEWQRGEPNDLLTSAQENSDHLCAVGWAWITWLQSEEGRAATRVAGKAFPRLRSEWAARLSRIEKDSANIARVASNLAVNELAWNLVCQHPQIGQALRQYSQQHAAGLKSIARTMAKSTVEALEAHQYRAALRELLGSGQYKLVERSLGKPNDYERDRVLGWVDNGGVYLMPAITLNAIKRLVGPAQLVISPQTLYGQMEQLGWLAGTGGSHTAKLISIGGEKQRVLHWLPSVLEDNDDGNAALDEGDEACTTLGL